MEMHLVEFCFPDNAEATMIYIEKLFTSKIHSLLWTHE